MWIVQIKKTKEHPWLDHLPLNEWAFLGAFSKEKEAQKEYIRIIEIEEENDIGKCQYRMKEVKDD